LGVAQAATAFNTSLVSRVALSDCSDVSADGDLVFVGRRAGGATILSVVDEAMPRILATWTHPSATTDIVGLRPLNGVLWLANQSEDEFCLLGLDLSDPTQPSIVSQLWRPPLSRRVHNLWADGTHLYLSGTGAGGGNYVVDVSNPASPVVETIITTGIHDNSVVDDILYIAGGYTGFHLYDVSLPVLPEFLSHFDASTPDTTFYAHNAWPIGTTGYVALGEEVAVPVSTGLFEQGSMRIVDFNDLANPAQVYRWRSESAVADPLVTIHNIYVVGPFAYVSYYQDGLKILDISDPTSPVEVAFYDTFPDTPTELFQGCWGVHPFQGEGRIFLSDRTYGFFQVSFNGARKSTIRGRVLDANTLAPLPGAEVRSLSAERHVIAGAGGSYELRTGSGTHVFQVIAPGYQTESAVLALSDLGTLDHDFLLDDTLLGGPAGTSTPAALALTAPSPNPSRAGIAATVELPGSRRVTAEIYDARGRRIRSLFEGDRPAGGHTIQWDGRLSSGEPAPAGVYELRVVAGSQARSERFTLLP
jgi:choice-of-anchor B domain-containing protein